MRVITSGESFNLILCDTFYKRFKGLMFVKNFDYCLLFKKCSSIHTFFMYTNIDVVMTDIDNNVLYVYNNLKPWRVILPKKNVYATYEFPANSIDKNLSKIIVEE